MKKMYRLRRRQIISAMLTLVLVFGAFFTVPFSVHTAYADNVVSVGDEAALFGAGAPPTVEH